MSLLQVPTLTDGSPAYRQRTRLDGQEWTLDFVFNAREGRWALSIIDLDGNSVVTGQPIVCGLNLLTRAIAGPPGLLIAIAEDEGLEAPGLTELGGRVTLWYVDISDPLLA